MLGWFRPNRGLDAFTEAPLTVSALSSADELNNASVILVSAPGAVGKSTLARQIGAVTGSVCVDLAEAAPVGANTLTGGLVNAGIYDKWQRNAVAVLLDGLDEARLKVTQSAFDAFIEDVGRISRNRSSPTVLFGRTGAVEEVWLRLQAMNCPTVVLEIGYYDDAAALRFAEVWLIRANADADHLSVRRSVLDAILSRLREQTETDGRRFAGYAPVIQAVAMRVARDMNPSALLASVQRGEQPITLISVSDAILERERSKLDNLAFQNETLKGVLYNREEQLARLVAKTLGTPPRGIVLPFMNAYDAGVYDQALTTWADDHAFFLDAARNAASTAVFDAVIMVAALSSSATSEQAVARQLSNRTANPFLAAFHPVVGVARAGELTPEHVGLLYASIRASLSLGDTASLEIVDSESAEDLEAKIIITVCRRNESRPIVMEFDTTQVGVLKIGAQVEDVEIDLSYATVEIGAGTELTLVSPVTIRCGRLNLNATNLIVEPTADAQSSDAASTGQTSVVSLEADECTSGINAVPIVRRDTHLTVNWRNSDVYPWNSFSVVRSLPDDEIDREGLRRLRKFIISFRSHSRGRLARYKEKFEGRRMTKGAGRRILDALIEKEVIVSDGTLYYLDSDRLNADLDMSYGKAAASDFSDKSIEFVRRAMEI